MIRKCVLQQIKYLIILSLMEQQLTQTFKGPSQESSNLQIQLVQYPLFHCQVLNTSLIRQKNRNFKQLIMTKKVPPLSNREVQSQGIQFSKLLHLTQPFLVRRDRRVLASFLESKILYIRLAVLSLNNKQMSRKEGQQRFLTNKSIKERSLSASSWNLIQMNLIKTYKAISNQIP